MYRAALWDSEERGYMVLATPPAGLDRCINFINDRFSAGQFRQGMVACIYEVDTGEEAVMCRAWNKEVFWLPPMERSTEGRRHENAD